MMKEFLRKLGVLTVTLLLLFSMSISAYAATKLNNASATLYVGKTLQLKLIDNKAEVKWTSANKKIATVSTNGKVSAKKAGTTIITAKSGAGSTLVRLLLKRKMQPLIMRKNHQEQRLYRKENTLHLEFPA